MVYLYSGTPGSGKTYHAIKDIVFKLKMGGNVIANFEVNTESIKPMPGVKQIGEFVYVENEFLTVDFLKRYARAKHKKGKEAQTLVVIDEAQTKFNCRTFAEKDRLKFNEFFSKHRHWGYNCILIAQSNILLDKQIRVQIEYDVIHRCVNNFRIIGILLTMLHIKTFAVITKWFGNNERVSFELMRFSMKVAKRYDSYTLFDDLADIGTDAAADAHAADTAPGTKADEMPNEINGEVNKPNDKTTTEHNKPIGTLPKGKSKYRSFRISV
jgi:zona occludens toxin